MQFFFFLSLVFVFAQSSFAAENIEVVLDSYSSETNVTYQVRIKNFPKAIDAIGMDVKYSSGLKLVGYERGSLTKGFDFFAVTDQSGKGYVRIGGIETSAPIPQGSGGTIALLFFEALGNAKPPQKLGLMNLKDDLNLNSKSSEESEKKKSTQKSPSQKSSSSKSNLQSSSSSTPETSDDKSEPESSEATSDASATDSPDVTVNQYYTINNQKQQTSKPNRVKIAKETYHGTNIASAKTGRNFNRQRKNSKTSTLLSTSPASNIPQTHLDSPNELDFEILSAIERTNALLEANANAVKKPNTAFNQIASSANKIKTSASGIENLMMILCAIMLLNFAALVVLIIRTQKER